MSSIALVADNSACSFQNKFVKSRVLGVLRPFDAVTGITLWTLLLLQHGLFWNVVTVVAAVLAFSRSVRYNGWFWLSLSTLLAIPACLHWQTFEDHIFFALLWLAAIGISQLGIHKRRSLVFSARSLIVLAMGIAVFWKAISGQYMSTEMFHHKMLTDQRFCTLITKPVAGLSDAAVTANRTAILGLREVDGPQSVQISTTATLGMLAIFMTYWTILIELAIAACFAFPQLRLLDRLRNPLLMVFLVSTYVVVPVIGFGLLFATMAIAQCRREERAWQYGFFLFAALLAIYSGLGYDHLV